MAGEGFENQEEATGAFRANSLIMNLFPKGTRVPADGFSPDEEQHGVHFRNTGHKHAAKHLPCVSIN